MRTTLSQRVSRSFRWRGLGGTLRQVGADATALLDLPWLYLSHHLPGPPNARELRIFALKRSGHHAFMR